MKIPSSLTFRFPNVLVYIVALIASSGMANASENWKIQRAKSPEIVISDRVLHTNDPHKLFGFNINFRQFQEQLWEDQKPKAGVIDALRPFKGAIFRYPGGVVANSFHWKEAIGDPESRKPQSSYYQRNVKPVEFGIDEYADFVATLGGMPWYVLNLVGEDLNNPNAVAEKEQVAKSNLELANYLNKRFRDREQPLHLQLGNELDRGYHQWSGKKYADRAKAVVDLVKQKANSKEFEFVSFMRDFKWTYKRDKKDLKHSKAKDFMRATITELAQDVPSYSLHHYYDGNRKDGKSRAITFWLRLMSKSIADHKELTHKSASIWITEHGRQPMSRQPGKDNSKQSTSNMAAAISTADYLIALTQFPEVKGAVWHGLNAGPWQLFDYSVKHKDLRPRPIYWGLRVLRMMELEQTLESRTSSPNLSDYSGGYDLRAAAFRDDEKNQLGLRVVNRAPRAQKLKVKYAGFSDTKVKLKHYYVGLDSELSPDQEIDDLNLDIEPEETAASFAKDGTLYIEIPASSVSTIMMRKWQ